MSEHGYIDPAEGGAITAAFNWAQDHGYVMPLPTIERLAQTVARLAPTCDPGALKAMITEYAVTDRASVYALALAPPFPPLAVGMWKAGPISAVTAPPQNGIALLIICEPEALPRLRGELLHGGAQ